MKIIFAVLIAGTFPAFCAEPLTIDEAEQLAVRNHPRIAAARAEGDIAQAASDQVRARQKFQLNGGVTGSVAEHGTRQGIGGVNAPDLFTRLGTGISISQLITDFGRTSLAVESAQETVAARRQSIAVSEAEVRLQARVAFFRALQAQAANAAAEQVLKSRNVLLRQVKTLAGSELRSTLDVGFAEVRLSEAELLGLRTENERLAAVISLAQVMGLDGPRDWNLQEPVVPEPELSVDEALAAAVKNRPDLLALQHEIAAARKQAESDRKLNMPTVEAVGLGGFIPAGDPRIRSRYAGIALNLNVPILNGSAFSARHRESAARLALTETRYRELILQLGASVRTQYLALATAKRNIELSQRFQEQAARTLRLSEARYTAGLGTIVEYTQAQVDLASAQIAFAVARYEAGVQLARLDFAVGNLR